jgi:hypothetical protein
MPKYLSWLLKPLFELDCVDIVWYLAAKLSIQRPEYLSNERDVECDPGAFVTSYRILVSTAVAFLGSLKSQISFYSNGSTAPIWLEWFISGLGLSTCVNFTLAQVKNCLLNYATPSLGFTSLVYMKTTR